MAPARVTEQLLAERLTLERVHEAATKETDPAPLWDQLTVPVGR
jgi:hypothetical protein